MVHGHDPDIVRAERASAGKTTERHVIVGGCWGVIAIDAEDLRQYYMGVACAAAIALVIAGLEFCLWMAL